MPPELPKFKIGVVNVYGQERSVRLKPLAAETGSHLIARACAKASENWGGEWRWGGVMLPCRLVRD